MGSVPGSCAVWIVLFDQCSILWYVCSGLCDSLRSRVCLWLALRNIPRGEKGELESVRIGKRQNRWKVSELERGSESKLLSKFVKK